MKTNRVSKNVITNAIVQVICAVSGLILPKVIIAEYGSTLNGMIGSISQFLIYAGLVEAGVGNAAMVALYAPLSKGNIEEISDVLSSAARKYKKTGLIYTALSCILAFLYPFTVSNQVDYEFAFFMTIILAMSGMIDYFLIGKYKVLLMADQRVYIVNIAKAVATCVLTIGSIYLLEMGVSLLIIKALAVVTHLGEAVFIRMYALRRYGDVSFSTKNDVHFSQQKSSLVHQICMVITYNTDLIVLTLMLQGDSLLEISVYSVYTMVLSFVKNSMTILYSGINATFGNIYALGDKNVLTTKFKQYESIYIPVLFVVYSCCMSLLLPFVACYTRDVTDVNYIRMDVAVLSCLLGLVSQIKEAHGTLVSGCGMYDETRKYAIWEAGVNIVVSLLLVRKMGIIGVLIGTLVSHVIMSVGVIWLTSIKVLPGALKDTVGRIIRNIIIFVLVCAIEVNFTRDVNTWIEWFVSAVIVAIINIVIIGGGNFLVEKLKSLRKKGGNEHV